jgi:hypothetical protein
MTTSGYAYDSQQGGETETTLWTNPSPTSSFSGQEVTLSDNYTNYKKIAFYFKYGTSSSYAESVEIYDTEKQIPLWYNMDDYTGRMSGAMAATSSGTIYSRLIWKNDSNNKFYIRYCYREGSSSMSNGQCIPTKITGIN